MSIATHDLTDWTADRAVQKVAVQTRDTTIDTMRGIAILMVIGIHSLPQPISESWKIAIDSALRPCVPIFLFTSGVMSAGKHQIPLLRRLKTVLIPYAIAFAAAYLYMSLHNPHMDHRPAITLARFGLAYVFVYYYVFIYVGCTICLWLLFKLTNRANDNLERRLTVALAVAIVAGLLAGAYVDPLMARGGFSAPLIEEIRLRDVPFWFSFLALGLLAGTPGNRAALSGMKGLLVTSAVATYAVYAAARIWQVGDYADYDSMAFFSYASAAALLLFALGFRSSILAKLGSGSYFIYLWHIFVVMLLRDHASLDRLGPMADFLVTFATTVTTITLALTIIRLIAPPAVVRWAGA